MNITHPLRFALPWLIGLLPLLSVFHSRAMASDAGYAVVVSQETQADEEWCAVVAALQERYHAQVIAYEDSVDESFASLRQVFPRYACFVARPEETTREFVAAVHQLTRRLDDDPYTDTLWGILTGFEAADALRMARCEQPLVVRKVASGTDVALEMAPEGVWYCELQPQRMVKKLPGGKPQEKRGPLDTTQALVNTLNEYQADLFVTSGHATERDWQIGFRYRNGSFRSKAGKLVGIDTQGNTYPVQSTNPKVYLPIGNCLMGHIDGPDAMALAWMHSAGVHQMIGYTVPTWFGYAGWGCLDYFLEQPGRYTFTEAFHANQRALVYCIEHGVGNRRGMEFDRDVVAFYGDPAWQARMADGPRAFEQRLEQNGDLFTLTITGNVGAKSFAPVNTNGSQRGGRPFVQFLPCRVSDVRLLQDSGLGPVITDDFVLVPNPGEYDAQKSYVIRFRAKIDGL